MNCILFKSRNSYGTSVNNIRIKSSIPFDRIDAQIIPHNLPYHKTAIGVSTSSLRTEVDFALDSTIVNEMRALQKENSLVYIPVFFFQIQTQTFEGKNKRQQSSIYLRITPPWTNIGDSDKAYHSAVISMQEISVADLPKPLLGIKLLQNFDQENLETAYVTTEFLDLELSPQANLKNIRLTLQAYKQTIAAYSAPIAQLPEGQIQRVQIGLPDNLARSLAQAQGNSYYSDQVQHILNISATGEQSDGQKFQHTQFFPLDNPIFVALAKTNHQIALQIKDVLNKHFPQAQANINEQDEWFGFQIDGYNFQYGLKTNAVYAYIKFQRIDYRVNSKTLKNDMAILNKQLKLKHKLKEIDSCFNLEAKIDLSKLNERAIVKLLSELLDIANNPTVIDFRATYESK